MSRKRAWLLGALAWMATQATAQRLPDSFFPESIAADEQGTLYVGSATQSRIVRIPAGARDAEAFVATGAGGLVSVQGLAVDAVRQRLYACSADLGVAKAPRQPSALIAFALDDGTVLGSWPMPEEGFCNDIAALPDGRLLLSDTAASRVLRFDPTDAGQIDIWLAHPLLGGAEYNGNGITIANGTVYLTTFSDGRLIRIPVAPDGAPGSPAVLQLPRPLAGADALRTLEDGALLLFENDIAGGNGRVTRVSIDGETVRLDVLAEGLAEPVSGVVQGDHVVVVESQFSRLFGPDAGVPAAPFELVQLRLPKNGDAEAVRLPCDFAYPNGIAVDGNGRVIVGSITAGKLLRREADGRWQTLFAGSETVFAATALRLDAARQRLWGSSPDFLGAAPTRLPRVFTMPASGDEAPRVYPIPDDGFPNDLAFDSDGAVLLTDSANGRVLRLAPGLERFDTLLEDPRLRSLDRLGAAGIARASDGKLVIGVFGVGTLYLMEFVEGRPRLRPLTLGRLIENPDGLAFAPDGSLLVIEAAIDTGNGRLLRIPDPFAPGRRRIETLLTGLESPVNVSVGPAGEVWISESRVRHRMRPQLDLPSPDEFRLLRYDVFRDDAR